MPSWVRTRIQHRCALLASRPQHKRDPLGGNMNMHDRNTQVSGCAALAAVFVLTGCTPFAPDSLAIRIQMDVTSYTRLPPINAAVVSFTVVNEGSAPAYVGACGGQPLPTVQRSTATGWEDHTGDACVAIVGMGPVPLAPGQSVAGTWRWDLPGTYRFRVYYSGTAAQGYSRTATGPDFEIR